VTGVLFSHLAPFKKGKAASASLGEEEGVTNNNNIMGEQSDAV
jgi:hypothetical protein